MPLSFPLTCIIFIISNIHSNDAISWYLKQNEQKCLSEYVQAHELLIGEFSIKPPRISGVDKGVHISVSDPEESYVYEKNVDNGKFAFTSVEDGEYVFCFQNIDRREKIVSFSVHSGVKAKDYSNIAKKENLKPLETKLKQLEDISRDTFESYTKLRSLEDKIYQDNVNVSSTAFWFGILLTGILAAISFWQMFHLKQFFKKKKMI